MDNINSIEAFSKRINVELKIASAFKTAGEFIEVISGRFLDFLQNDPTTKELISSWKNRLIEERNLRYCGLRELSDAVNEIRYRLMNLKHWDSQKTLMKIDAVLEKLKEDGSCDCLMEIPDIIDLVYGELRFIYCISILRVDTGKLTFAPSAYRAQLTQDLFRTSIWKNFANLSSWNDNTLLACIWGEPKDYWEELVRLKEYWSHRDYVSDNHSWPRIEGEGLDLLIKADHVRRQTFVKMVGSKLKFVDAPNFEKKYFDLDHFQHLVNGLLKGIRDLIFPEWCSKNTKSPHVPDKERCEQFAKNYWSQHPKANHDEVIQKIREEVKFERKIPYQDTTLKTWIRKVDPRKNKPRGPVKKSKTKKKG